MQGQEPRVGMIQIRSRKCLRLGPLETCFPKPDVLPGANESFRGSTVLANKNDREKRALRPAALPVPEPIAQTQTIRNARPWHNARGARHRPKPTVLREPDQWNS